MIGWTKLVLATAWVMSVSLGCAAATSRPSTPVSITSASNPPSSHAPDAYTPEAVRSPRLDYGDGPRSADDGEVLGADRQSPQDWLIGGATNEHFAPGWALHDGGLHFDHEQVRAGHGGARAASACLPGSAPLAPDEARTYAALERAWLASREPALRVFANAVLEMPAERSRFLSCDER
jgi:hypothetical protein